MMVKNRLSMRAFVLLIILSVIGACSKNSPHPEGTSQNVDTSDVSTTFDENASEWSPLELSAEQFYAVWGAENYVGQSDLSVEASLWSDSEAIHMIIRVKDDTLSVADDVLHSDHVEVWLSASPAPMKYIAATDTGNSSTRLFHYNNSTNVDSFLAELDNPFFDYSTPSEQEEENFRGRINTTERGQLFWREYGFQNSLDQLKARSISEEYVFDGMVHWGFFPDERTAFLYDEERYEIIEAHANADIGMPKYAPTYSVVITEEGYTIQARFTPESLGFVSSSGVGRIDYMIDVVDVDAGKRQETILSSSRDRVWGNREHFNSYKLQNPIDVELVAGLDWLGSRRLRDEGRYIRELPHRFLFTSNGWVGIVEKEYKADKDLPWSRVRQLAEASLPNMDEITFRTQKIGYIAYSGGGHSFDVIQLPGIDHNNRSDDRLLINGIEARQENGGSYEILSFFTYPDSLVGFIQARWGYEWGYCRPTGLCGCNIKDDLELVRVDSTGMLAAQHLVTVDECGPNIIAEKDTLDDQLLDNDWIRSGDITWEEKGRQVALDFEKVRVVFHWNEEGKEVRYEIEEKAGSLD